MKDCIFCQIVKCGSKSYKIYEDEYILSILDKSPSSKGHCLLIPKKHYKDIYDINEKTLKRIAAALKKVSFLLKKKLNCTGINILHASGNDAQQSIFHFHFHLLPRYKGDGINAWVESPRKGTTFDDEIKSLYRKFIGKRQTSKK